MAIMYVLSVSKTYSNIGVKSAEKIDTGATYRVTAINVAEITKTIADTKGAIAAKTPTPHATPFPPLNPINGDKECPTTAVNPIKICSNGCPGK